MINIQAVNKQQLWAPLTLCHCSNSDQHESESRIYLHDALCSIYMMKMPNPLRIYIAKLYV